jgi:hypothetical protein
VKLGGAGRGGWVELGGIGGGNAGRALYPQFARISDIRYFVPFNTAKYNGLLTQVTRRFGGSMLGLSYTLSRSIGYADDTDGNFYSYQYTYHYQYTGAADCYLNTYRAANSIIQCLSHQRNS